MRRFPWAGVVVVLLVCNGEACVGRAVGEPLFFQASGVVQATAAPSGPATGLASGLGATVAAILSDPSVVRAHWGVMVAALDGTPLYGLREGEYFQPASNAKLFTTAAALALLGPERRFTTRIQAPFGSGGEGTLHGDLELIGAGDAFLSGRQVPYLEPVAGAEGPPPPDALRYLEELADGVVKAGVKRVEGEVVGDDTLFPYEPYATDWAIDDMVWGYGAPVSALSVADNQMQLTVTPGARVGDPALVTVEPMAMLAVGVPYYAVEATVVTGALKTASAVRVDRAVGSSALQVSGAIAVDAKPEVEEVAIADPAQFAAAALKGMLEARGVRVSGAARARHRAEVETRGFLAESRMPLPALPRGPVAGDAAAVRAKDACAGACPVLVTHTSPTVAEDVVVTNKVSQNLHAELLLHQLGLIYGEELPQGAGRGSTAEGARVVRQFLLNAGLDGDDFVFYDGSGLSGHDLVTPRAVVKLLAFAAMQPWFGVYKSSLPVGGVDGGLAGRFTEPELKGKVFAKTGTLGEVRALSGYLECVSGRTVVFSVTVGNRAPGSAADRVAMDKVVAAIAAAE